MALLTPQQVLDRIALYEALKAAMLERDRVDMEIPLEPPPTFDIEAVTMSQEALKRTLFVIRRAWPALRAAVLKDAQKALDDAEAAVQKFEAGEEVSGGDDAQIKDDSEAAS